MRTSPGETASLHYLGTLLETGMGLRQEGCHWSLQNVFLGGLGYALNSKGFSEQLIGSTNGSDDPIPNRFRSMED